MKQEEWKEIPDYYGLYEASDFGGIRGIDRIAGGQNGKRKWPGKILKQKRNGQEHLQVRLSKDGFAKMHYVHRLVLSAFIGPCPKGMEACHYPDVSPANNALDNLRWDTHKGNCADTEIHGTRMKGEKNPFAKLTVESVIKARQLRLTGKTLKEIGDEFGVSLSSIHMVLAGKTWRHV